ncbi:class I SAM-dependent methyltransferase [Beggiatoa leptomitoformis]|uniref:class I SAM-dependent methyltransferase n=1 Tax=Beggiatoa leptomitoformis TaxID=288004 RepID=UPI000B25B25C|nr:class I SAM-dependent methyltransferase [Beggiatoa leptomitoformis]
MEDIKSVEDYFGTMDVWSIYHRVVTANNLSHREIYTDVARVLSELEDEFSFLDLGCGDATYSAPILVNLPITYYCGVDLSATALELAEKNLSLLACPVELHKIDLLQALQNTKRQYDVIFSSFAIHHLSYEEKSYFFQSVIKRLSKNGILLLVDAMREENEDLPTYLQRYCYHIRNEWQGIRPEEKELVCCHVMENDFVETASTLEFMAKQAGFSSCQNVSKYSAHQVIVLKNHLGL